MTFLDTGTLVGAVLEQHPEHAACLEALEESETPFTDAHALAEMFATLTGFYRVPVAAAAELTLGLKANLAIEPLPLADYEKAIGVARQRGVMGGGINGDGQPDVVDANADWDTPRHEWERLWYEDPGAGKPAQVQPWPRHAIWKSTEFYAKPQTAIGDYDGVGRFARRCQCVTARSAPSQGFGRGARSATLVQRLRDVWPECAVLALHRTARSLRSRRGHRTPRRKGWHLANHQPRDPRC